MVLSLSVTIDSSKKVILSRELVLPTTFQSVQKSSVGEQGPLNSAERRKVDLKA